jgi:hypothetical protein
MEDNVANINEVKPGDLITADLVNQIIRGLNALAGSAPGGTVTVPSVFGRSLSDAKALILIPGSQLFIGGVLNATGLAVDPDDPANAALRVIFQLPVPGQLVSPGTTVSLVVAGEGSTGPAAGPAPTINGFKPAKVNVLTVLRIDGTNFANDMTKNLVSFDGIRAATPGTDSTINELVVMVPDGIPGAPQAQGVEKTVKVVVDTPTGQVSSNVIILAPAGSPTPTISSVQKTGDAAAIPALGDPLTIAGANFSTKAGGNKVFFDSVQGEAPVATATQLVLAVPALIPGLAASGDIKTINIHVEADGVSSSSFPKKIQKL